jgi:hypothetical protein
MVIHCSIYNGKPRMDTIGWGELGIVADLYSSSQMDNNNLKAIYLISLNNEQVNFFSPTFF